jgi:hypothetical protein
MGLHGKWFSQRDMRFMDSINAEFFGDVIQSEVVLFKICPSATPTNVYGESDPATGKMYYPGISATCLIDKDEIRAEYNEHGIDKEQPVEFRFREKLLQELNFYPQEGDLVFFNERYYEVDNVIQEQFRGSIPGKSLSINVRTHYTRLSRIGLVERQV